MRLTGCKVTAVIDLAATDRYYDSSAVLQSIGAKHVKLSVPGKQRVPQNIIEQFNHTLSTATNNGNCVVVHCTHGVNRTGFLVVNYLLESSIISSVQEGLEQFASVRGYAMSKQYLVDDLISRHPNAPDPRPFKE